VAQTPGFTDADLTIEKIVERWQEIMEPTGSRIIASGETDPKTWNVKPYRPR
jgi:hypothetical protein